MEERQTETDLDRGSGGALLAAFATAFQTIASVFRRTSARAGEWQRPAGWLGFWSERYGLVIARSFNAAPPFDAAPLQRLAANPPLAFPEALQPNASSAEPADRDGRPLPWRLERSLALDLFGNWGLIFGALSVGLLALSILISRSIEMPVRSGPLPPISLPGSTSPDAQNGKTPVPDPRQQSVPNVQAPPPNVQAPSGVDRPSTGNLPVSTSPDAQDSKTPVPDLRQQSVPNVQAPPPNVQAPSGADRPSTGLPQQGGGGTGGSLPSQTR